MGTLIGAGLAFAVAGKFVNFLFPSEQSTATRDEMKRHNLAMERYTVTSQKWQKRISERMAREHYYDRLNQSSEIRKGISLDYIMEYVKKNNLKVPAFEDFYEAELAKNPSPSGYSNLMRSAAIATMGSVATYLAV